MKNKIVVDGVEYFRETPEMAEMKKVVERYEWLKADIEHELQNAQALYDNMKEEGLSFGTVEAEGYVRCAKLMVNLIKRVEEQEL